MSTVDPQWVKSTMVEDYAEAARQRGVNVSSSEVERAVLEDLRITDAVERESKPTRVVEREELKAASAELAGARARAEAEATGHKLYKRPIAPPRVDPRLAFLARPPRTDKELAIITRLGRILAIRSKFRPSLTNDYAVPALADEFATLMEDLRGPRGEFMGKSARDCERMFWAKAERLCEKSTGKLGPYWVK